MGLFLIKTLRGLKSVKLSKLLRASEPFEIVTIILLNGEKSTIIFSGGGRDFKFRCKDYDVYMIQKEKDGSYTILVK